MEGCRLQHIWPLQSFLWEWPSLLVSSRIQWGPLSSLGECPPRKGGDARGQGGRKGHEKVKQVGLQISQKDPRQGDYGNFISATYKCDDCSRH